MSIYIYGFQSFGDDGLRELDETLEDDDDGNDDTEEYGLLGFVIDEWLIRILRQEDDDCSVVAVVVVVVVVRRWYGWWAYRRFVHICRQRVAKHSRCSGTIFGNEWTNFHISSEHCL